LAYLLVRVHAEVKLFTSRWP